MSQGLMVKDKGDIFCWSKTILKHASAAEVCLSFYIGSKSLQGDFQRKLTHICVSLERKPGKPPAASHIRYSNSLLKRTLVYLFLPRR
ncbi:hypothetical protein AVEN_237586-1 [Araneus ventricosus]|uniref:Uncharacterized protein n=1 Tax=Araneus ventricosus TaxID=182803 RepID=A0A4Y2QQS3_ARAVE|nr:hypothetical protein AVEN_237586-1 [Araneus ventricosus]